MRPLLLLLVAVALSAVSAARAEIAVVVNPESGVTEMTRDQVVNIYMGRYQGLPSGITAFPVDLVPLRQDFYSRLVDRTLAEINSYWARLIFSGRATPPRRLDDATAVLEVVSNNRGAIGYLPSGAVDDSRVTVVLELVDD
ncbi:hypothetical protein [Salinisphaera sp. PC39]|uniref:hypothetical protein n=1 Tax=Salinisphaera sp. PC39 TaxID=1304156 RepID=UPI00333E9D24